MTGKNIIWLASYPKSGNTWFRAFLSALRNGGKVDINNIATSGIFSSKTTFETVCDTDADELTRREAQTQNREVYRYLSGQHPEKIFIKVHDAFICDDDGIPLIPEDATHCAVYFVRNPLDVAISFANHNNRSVDHAIHKYLNNPECTLAKRPVDSQFPQPLLSWSGHVESWLRRPQFPVHMVRYEDMLADTFTVFSELVRKMGLTHTDDEIRAAIAASSFDALRRQEAEKGFREKNPESPRFFNTGTAGRWKKVLTQEQADSIKEHHGVIMQDVGYTIHKNTGSAGAGKKD